MEELINIDEVGKTQSLIFATDHQLIWDNEIISLIYAAASDDSLTGKSESGEWAIRAAIFMG